MPAKTEPVGGARRLSIIHGQFSRNNAGLGRRSGKLKAAPGSV